MITGYKTTSIPTGFHSIPSIHQQGRLCKAIIVISCRWVGAGGWTYQISNLIILTSSKLIMSQLSPYHISSWSQMVIPSFPLSRILIHLAYNYMNNFINVLTSNLSTIDLLEVWKMHNGQHESS